MNTQAFIAERRHSMAALFCRPVPGRIFKCLIVLAWCTCLLGIEVQAQLIATPGDPFAPSEPMVAVKRSSASASTLALTPALHADSLALVDLYDSTNGPGWIRKANWKTGRINTWAGITITNGRVTRIDLTNNNLTGSIPSSIGNLTGLSVFDLSVNKLSGRIPASVGNFTSLLYFYLHYNELTGAIPVTCGNLVNVLRFYVHRNKLSGPIPSTLGNLTKMQYIGLHANDLTGNLEWIANLRAMIQLFYYGNPNLDCVIPESIGNLTNMTVLAGGGWMGVGEFLHTKVKGPIPATLGNCTKLTAIYLDNSELTGTVPASLSNLKSLKILSLFNNKTLGGDLTTMITGLNKLESLVIYRSNIGGSLPPSVITTNLQTVYLGATAVSGNLPPTFTNAVNLIGLGLDSLGITQLPNWSASFPKLIWLNLRYNKLDTLASYQTRTNKALLELMIDNNRLDFADLEPLFNTAAVHPFKRLDYAPQEKSSLPDMTYVLSHHSTWRIDAPKSGQFSTYTWEKQEGGTWQNVQSLNESGIPRAFVINDLLPSHAGKYRYTVVNSRVPALTFSRIVNVSVTAPGSTIQLFPVHKKAGAVCGKDTIVLSGSQVGIAYQLRRDSVNAGGIVMGTSLPITWTGLTASGTYTILASDTATGTGAVLPDHITINCAYDSLVALNAVGIGGAVPEGYSLAVAGKAIASGLHLKIARQWPDYVFQPAYHLMPIGTVAAFIKKYGHLPGVPSAAQVAADANYSVSAMDLTLLEKIEELTLHLIHLKEGSSGRERTTSMPASFTGAPVVTEAHATTLPVKKAAPRTVMGTVMQAEHIGDMVINQSMAIGLTRPMPAGYRLAVGGNIIATGLDLKAPANWPDYVFAADYNLPSLEELRHFIKKHKHLPNMPSAREMSAKDVYDLAEMDVRLLEKVEELTLYTIGLSHRLRPGDDEGEAPAEDLDANRITSGRSSASPEISAEVLSAATPFAAPVEFEHVVVHKALSVASPRSVPVNYKLAVGGSIIAAAMDLKPPKKWPDYVFDADYKLLTMDELAAYIRQRGHLPNVPSAADMNKQGDYNTAEMDARILEKIEELTLYILALDAGQQSK